MQEQKISRHLLFERTEKRFEEDLVQRLLRALDIVQPPPGWYDRGPRGRKEVFDWKTMTVLLTLKFYWGFTYREMSAHLEHDERLLNALELPKAPAKSTLQKACACIPDEWLKDLDRTVLRGKKTGQAMDRPGGRPRRSPQRPPERVFLAPAQ